MIAVMQHTCDRKATILSIIHILIFCFASQKKNPKHNVQIFKHNQANAAGLVLL
jgi:hypothetical protein